MSPSVMGLLGIFVLAACWRAPRQRMARVVSVRRPAGAFRIREDVVSTERS